ncbi:MAG: response regulator [Myxococcales bacterium]|nr:response regulator [Myxococcales bacterium]
MAKRILVVDDDRNIGQILHASFTSKGYETIVSRNGEDAIAKFGETPPDLVLLDVLLPKMNGWEVCRKLKSTDHGAKIPVILMSAVYKNYKMQQDAINKYGADDFVEKPFQLSKLLDKIEEMIGAPDGPGVPLTPAATTVKTDDGEDAGLPAAAPAPSVSPDTVISLEGALDTIGFAELLHDVYVMGKSGYLLVRHGDVEKEVAIKDGYPVSVRTTLEEEYFGNFLVRKRKITAEQRDQSVARMTETKRLQGTILIEMGVLTPHEVVKYLKLQMREKLFEIFGWRDGIYKFTEDATVQGDITTLDMSTANVINEGVRLHYDLDRLLPIIDQWRPKYIRPGSNQHYRFQDIELTSREQAVYEQIDGTQSVAEVLAGLDLDTERGYQILYTLIICEMVELNDEPLAEPESIVPQQSDIDAEFEATEEMKAVEEALSAAPEKPAAAPISAAPVAPAAPAAPEKPAPRVEKEKAEPQPAKAEANEADAEEAEMRTRVLRVFNRVSQGNDFQVLGVGPNPTEHEIRVAYHKMAKEFHPDRFFGRASEEVRSQVEEIFRRATESYENVNTQEKIGEYIKKIESQDEAPKTDARIEGVKRIIMAEQYFQNGKQYLREKRFARAAAEFKKAMEISTNEAEYVAYYGWSLYNIPREKDITDEDKKLFADQSEGDLQFNGRESLNRAITLNPRSERAYLFLGAIYKQEGLKEFAEKQYEKALICNPNCIEALRELRLIKLQEQKLTQKKTLMDKLNTFFKRK